jgi:S1-C subfamily serine protease
MQMKNLYLLVLAVMLLPIQSFASELVTTIKSVKPSVVGVGIFTPMESPSSQLHGTGFVIGNGQYIATNYHVVSEPLNPEVVQHRAIFSGTGQHPQVLKATLVGFDPNHDLAILKIDKSLPALNLSDDEYIDEGTSIAFTGYPIGAVLGLYPATHRGIVAAVSPDVIPANRSEQLSLTMLDRLNQRFMIYQLDATAYPGNSGSPMYLIDTGEVVGVMNKVFVAESKETILSRPSGISYAIPTRYLRALAAKYDISL